MQGLHVAALISGGKDSFFSILHCLEQGHDVVALANLYPADEAVEDSDSFMYQTIGHAVIPLYEQALGLPLYRQAINGYAVSQSKTYETRPFSTESDETEELVPLFLQVKQSHPQVNAISTGAILSDYQRTRVESVAIRLGLTPLSFLWQYPRIVPRSLTSLLEDIGSAGQDSRIIKVSSGGLNSDFLWQNVAEKRTMHQLLKASQRFGSADDGAALGEGGEYETLTISGPAPLWKGRIVIHEQDRVVIHGEAGSAALRLSEPTVELHAEASESPLSRPTMLSDHFQTVFDELATTVWTKGISTNQHNLAKPITLDTTVHRLDDQTIFIGAQVGEGADAAQQMKSIMSSITSTLTAHGHCTTNIAYTSIILRDMADFPSINSVYAAAFTRPNPPARATIACAAILQPGQRLSVSVTSTKSQRREGLHVQSISYWAPANIGPYSQAIMVPMPGVDENDTNSTVTYIAGQIPLIPATMQLDSIQAESKLHNFLHQAVLSLQHLHRIASVTRVRSWQHAVAFIAATDDASAAVQAEIARRVWTRSYRAARSITDQQEDEDAGFDVWHNRYGTGRTLFETKDTNSVPKDGSSLLSIPPPQLVVIRIDSLPRNAGIEWVAFGSSSQGVDHELIHYRHLLDVFAARTI